MLCINGLTERLEFPHAHNKCIHTFLCAQTHNETQARTNEPTHTETFANDLLPTFHHSSLESSVTCTRSPGLKEIRQERRWTNGGMKGWWRWIGGAGRRGGERKVDGGLDVSGMGRWSGYERGKVANNERKKELSTSTKDNIIKLPQEAVVPTVEVKMLSSVCVPLQTRWSCWQQSQEVYVKNDSVAPEAVEAPDL